MKSLTNQICHNCSINVAIIDSLSNSPEFLQACTDVPVKLGIVPPQNGATWPFQNNMSWYAYMMYCCWSFQEKSTMASQFQTASTVNW